MTEPPKTGLLADIQAKQRWHGQLLLIQTTLLMALFLGCVFLLFVCHD